MINGIDYAYLWEHPEEYKRLTIDDLDDKAVLNFCEVFLEDTRKTLDSMSISIGCLDPEKTNLYEVKEGLRKKDRTMLTNGKNGEYGKVLRGMTRVTVLKKNGPSETWKVRTEGEKKSTGFTGYINKDSLEISIIAQANRMLEFLRGDEFDGLSLGHGDQTAEMFLSMCPQNRIIKNSEGDKCFGCS